MEENSYTHRESMKALKNLALEIKDMDERERLKTLEHIVRLETEGKGNRFWLLIVKRLLAKPELLPKALNLAEAKVSPKSNLRYLPVNRKGLVDTPANFRNKQAHSRFL